MHKEKTCFHFKGQEKLQASVKKIHFKASKKSAESILMFLFTFETAESRDVDRGVPPDDSNL